MDTQEREIAEQNAGEHFTQHSRLSKAHRELASENRSCENPTQYEPGGGVHGTFARPNGGGEGNEERYAGSSYKSLPFR